MHSVEGKSNVAGIRWSKDTGTVSWGKGFVLPVKLPTLAHDPYLHAALSCDTKYCGLVWRMEKTRRRWFVQLVQTGLASAKYKFLANVQTVGPSTVAIVADGAVGLVRFASSVDQLWQKMRVLQRAQDPSRRAMNPHHYAENGSVKKGPKRWAKSSRFSARQFKLQELERCLTADCKRDHGELANKIVGLGTQAQTEKLSYKGDKRALATLPKSELPGCSSRY